MGQGSACRLAGGDEAPETRLDGDGTARRRVWRRRRKKCDGWSGSGSRIAVRIPCACFWMAQPQPAGFSVWPFWRRGRNS